MLPFTQLLSQKLKPDLLPTFQQIPYLKVGNPTLIAAQFEEQGNLSGSKDCPHWWEQYLLKRTFAHIESLSWYNCQL